MTEKSFVTNDNDTQSMIGRSGNSDVDINIEIDTKAIAYAMLCSLYAMDRLDDNQFEKAIGKFESIMNKNDSEINPRSNKSNEKSGPRIFGFPGQDNRQKRWI
jgi:hypothetical protein